MPQIAVYIPEKLYIKLIEAGESKSKTVQQALKQYFGEG
jgi:hypothetical protein